MVHHKFPRFIDFSQNQYGYLGKWPWLLLYETFLIPCTRIVNSLNNMSAKGRFAKVTRSFYSNNLAYFMKQDENTILGELTRNNPFSLEDLQRNAWLAEIVILKKNLTEIDRGHIAFEYTIPRIGNRIDVVYIVDGIVFLLEFKVGSREYAHHALDQVTDYALDLKNFHRASHNILLVPMLIATKAPEYPFDDKKMKPGILEVIKCNQDNIIDAIRYVLSKNNANPLNASEWLNSPYAPTPTIIEAAQALYRGHNVADISRNDASAVNLNQTTAAINEIIEKSKHEHKKLSVLSQVYQVLAKP